MLVVLWVRKKLFYVVGFLFGGWWPWGGVAASLFGVLVAVSPSILAMLGLLLVLVAHPWFRVA